MAKRKLDKTIYVNMLMGRIPLIKGFTELKAEKSTIDIEAIINSFAQNKTKTGNEFRSILFPKLYSQLRMKRLTFPIEYDIKKELYWGKTFI